MKWIIVVILAIILQHFLPWWSIALAGFIYGFLIIQSRRTAFLNGFVGIFILWFGISLYVYFINDAIIAGLLADMLYMSHGLVVVAITGITGGIIGGLASLSGKYLRDITHWQPSETME